MWDNIINIHSSELLSKKTKEFRINKSLKKKSASQYLIYIYIYIYMNNLYFIPNNILTKFFKELTQYKNDYQ